MHKYAQQQAKAQNTGLLDLLFFNKAPIVDMKSQKQASRARTHANGRHLRHGFGRELWKQMPTENKNLKWSNYYFFYKVKGVPISVSLSTFNPQKTLVTSHTSARSCHEIVQTKCLTPKPKFKIPLYSFTFPWHGQWGSISGPIVHKQSP